MPNDSNSSPVTELLLLPGLMCDQGFWQPLLDRLPPALHASVVDYGDADSIGAMAEAASALAPPRFVLAGHSMGGRVALELQRMAGTRVQRLLLMDTGHLPRSDGAAGETERAGRMRLVELARRDGVRAMAMDWLKGMLHPDRLADAALVEQVASMFARKTAERFARQQQALLTRPDATQVLAALELPTLLLCGRQDNWSGVAQHEAMCSLTRRARLAVIEDCGHMVLMERPAETTAVILEFLA